ncbi:MAG: TetR/AcrR family transcriptional regulator [Chloroflexi bacterium]|nr:TetR/AcrR family transcriptional regulator [Chloroflexota bacterium]
MGQTPDRRQRRRQETIKEIKATARQQIAKDGATNLSLGAIARAMGMTPPALYRYFKNRNALIIALIVDAYDSMGKALENSAVDLAKKDHGGRFLALMHAYRGWAVAHPEAHALMYGATTDNVEMSEEQGQRFQGAVLRSMGAMVRVLLAAHEANCLTIPPQYQQPPPPVQRALMWMRAALQDEAIPLGILALAFTTWLRADGLVWQELHGHLPKTLFGAGDFYDMESCVLAERLGLIGSTTARAK